MIPIPISPTEREVMFSNDDESVKILMGMIITPQEDKWEIGERREERGERGGWGKQVMWLALGTDHLPLTPNDHHDGVFMMMMIDGGDFDQHDWFPYEQTNP